MNRKNNFPHYLRLLHYSIKCSLSTILMLLIARIKGINIGRRTHFIGLTHFYRKINSSISIDGSCKFLSSPSSNLIGINRPCILSTLEQNAVIIIGSNCGFSGTVIGAFKSITLGKDVLCGANTLITDSDWHTDDSRCGDPEPIIIENNVWLGEGVKVLKGVTIGENSVIGAGSVVTKNIPKDVIAAGNPCKVIKEINSINIIS